jgi:hypothetical protein
MPYPFHYLHFNALCMIFASSAVVSAWIAIWAGTCKQHWFWRALAIWALAVAPIPMRGYELAGILAITLPLLAVTIAMLDHFLFSRDQTWSRKPTIRFPLHDIFILTLLAALILTAVLHWWRDVVQLGISGGQHWGALLVNFAMAGTAFWMLTLLFKGAIQTLEAFQPVIAMQGRHDAAFRQRLYQHLLDAVVAYRVADRPNRFSLDDENGTLRNTSLSSSRDTKAKRHMANGVRDK